MAATVQQKLKPSGVWYVVAALVFVVGSIVVPIVLAVAGFAAFQDEIDKFESVPIDGGGQVSLEAGDYTVYAEGPGVDEFSVLTSSDLEIRAPDGDPVTLSVSSSAATYDVNGREGSAALTFNAPVDGTYEIVPLESFARSDNITRIAVGPGFGDVLGAGVPLWVAAGVIGFLSFVVALILLIVVAVKRGKSKRQQRLAAGGYGGPGYGAPGQPAQPGYGAPGQPAQPGYGAPAQPTYPPPPGAGVPPPGTPPPPGGYQPPQSPIT